MQAIITRYMPATNFKPARIKASCERGSGFFSAQSEGDWNDAHRAACDALCARFDAEDAKKYGPDHVGQWARPKASGQIPSGEFVFCFIETKSADARVKAAAPELLRALRDLRQNVDKDLSGYWTESTANLMQQADAAIANADGKAP